MPRRRWPRPAVCDRFSTTGTCRSTSTNRSRRHRTRQESTIGGIEPPDDLRAVHAILESAFAEDPADHPEPFDRWLEEHETSPSYDPSLWLLARDGDVPVGALSASIGDGGWVDWLAVLASHRGRGIGLALLSRSFATFAERGMRRVMLNVDAENVTGATAVYERAGMRVVNAWDLWER